MNRAAYANEDDNLITLSAEIREESGPALDPDRHEPQVAGELA